MNKFILTAAFGILAVPPVLAADPYIPSSDVIFSDTSVFEWSGFYAGANVGYGWAQIESGGFMFDELEGVFGGIQIGYNYDFGGFVLGAEADVQLSNISYEEDILGATGRLAIDTFGTIRARGGIVVDRFLPYVTGGLAWANASGSLTAGGATLEVDDSYVGWTAGLGAEYAVTHNVTIKAEYLFIDFGDADFDTGVDVGLTTHVVRTGVNFLF